MSKKDQNISKHADFLKGELTDYLSNPLLMFKKWYQEAHDQNCASPNAMSICTVSKNGQPSSRTVYMREVLEEGFI